MSKKSDCPVVIPYYGGKYELSKQLIPLLSHHERYFEPFFGGGSMFFRKAKADSNVLNDIDNDLVNLYITVLKRFEEFCDHVFWMARSRILHDKYREDIKSSVVTSFPDVERAAKYFYIVRNAFNNKPLNTFSKDTYWRTDIVNELKVSKEKLNGSTIENLDFGELVERYSPIRPNDLFYFDPPYAVTMSRKAYYRNVFNQEQHIKLADVCKYIDNNGGKFMVSYDDVKEIEDLYKGYEIEKIETKYVGANPDIRGKVKTELVIMNYKAIKQGVLF